MPRSHVWARVLTCARSRVSRSAGPDRVEHAEAGQAEHRQPRQGKSRQHQVGVDPADTRARRLRVTRRGKRLGPKAIAAVEAVDAEFFSELRSADAVEFLAPLARLPASVVRNARSD